MDTADSPTAAESGAVHRVTALSHQLVEVHLWLRDQLDLLRSDPVPALGGPADASPADVPPDPAATLRAHCLSFCAAVDRHHGSEDTAVFPALADREPRLRPVLDQLAHDHVIVAAILERVAELASRLHDDPATRTSDIRGELDGLAVILESHFRYEERTITDALDQLGRDGTLGPAAFDPRVRPAAP
ncbi:hemerythrin domain-containing protein [Jiangella asiatica]|uniref:Hemerythrin domain-containing protein n=1 Tax=Jiangella asiatica TaxID=2530372 RepID=A0A4V2Z2E5_9ACTN|nr:hemerythrin domain-containing protein [Jiangella asiatica]TDE08578.1 hemerythrin domain-containing protein [Jiangella asiatica]